jgi:hypothetical protein
VSFDLTCFPHFLGRRYSPPEAQLPSPPSETTMG